VSSAASPGPSLPIPAIAAAADKVVPMSSTWSRLRPGEIIAAVGAVALAVCIFLLPWYGLSGRIARALSGLGAATSVDGWNSLTINRWLMLATWPVYIIFAVFPAVVLGIFGSRYIPGAAALAVLSVAMLANLGTGNVTVVLLMGGKSSWGAINTGAALIVNIGLNLLLIPHLGILGAAIAWGAGIVVDNVAALIELRWVLGLAPVGPGYGLTAALTIGCFGVVGIAARAALGETLMALVVTLAIGAVAFAGALYRARAPLQLSGMTAALRPRAVAPAASRPREAA